MNAETLNALNSYALVSLCVAAAYYCAYTGIAWLLPAVHNLRAGAAVVSRPGEMVHQALRHVGRRWEAWSRSVLLFAVSLFLLLEFGRRDPMFGQLPFAVALLASAGVVVVLACAAFRMLRLLRYRAMLTRVLERYNELARRLVEVQLRGHRDFASVALDQFCIDHVVAGPQGIYAIQMILPPAGSEVVKCTTQDLIFGPTQARISLLPFRAAVIGLQKALQSELGIDIRVNPVVVVPECRVHGAQPKELLLVNLRACTAFIGWRQQESTTTTWLALAPGLGSAAWFAHGAGWQPRPRGCSTVRVCRPLFDLLEWNQPVELDRRYQFFANQGGCIHASAILIDHLECEVVLR